MQQPTNDDKGTIPMDDNYITRLGHVEQNQARTIALLDRLEKKFDTLDEKVDKASKINIPALGLGWSILFGLVMLLGTMAVYNINTNMAHLASVDDELIRQIEGFVPRGEHMARWEYNEHRFEIKRKALARIENDLNDRVTRLEADIQRDEERIVDRMNKELDKARADLDKSDAWIIEQLNSISRKVNGGM